ncbi:MAG: hypothetical protein ACRC6E_10295 [Fusobacteriaceae bacterium]
MFKPKKFQRGDYTCFMSIKGETKMKKGEAVVETVENGEDHITGEKLYKEVVQKHKYTTLNIIKNYEEGEEPSDFEDRETYFLFASSNTKEADYVSKDKETKAILASVDFKEEAMEFTGELAGKKIRIPVSDLNERMFQVFLLGEEGNLEF